MYQKEAHISQVREKLDQTTMEECHELTGSVTETRQQQGIGMPMG